MISKKKKRNNIANGVSTKKRDVTDLLNSLDLYGGVRLPEAVIQAQSLPNTIDAFGVERAQPPVQIPYSIGGGYEEVAYPKQGYETEEEYDARRRAQLDYARRKYQGQLTPEEEYIEDYYNKYGSMTGSGSVTSISPMTYVHPAGDLEALISSVGQMVEGDYLEGMLGGSLALGSIFLPGTVQLKSTKGGSVFENMLDKSGRINRNNVIALANKEGVNKGESFILNKVASKMPEDKIDYVQFKQMVNDELAFEIGTTSQHAGYGVSNVYSPMNEMKSKGVINDLFDRFELDDSHPDFLDYVGKRDILFYNDQYVMKKAQYDALKNSLYSGGVDEIVSKLREIRSEGGTFLDLVNEFPYMEGLPPHSYTTNQLSDMERLSYGASVGPESNGNPMKNLFDAIHSSNRPIRFDYDASRAFAATMLMREKGLTLENIIADPDDAVTNISGFISDVFEASNDAFWKSGSDIGNYIANARNNIIDELRHVLDNANRYRMDLITKEELTKELIEYSFDNPDVYADEFAESVVLKKAIKKDLDFFETRSEPLEKLMSEYPELRSAVDEDLTYGRKFFDSTKSETSLLTNPSGNLPTSTRHFPEDPSAHVRSFESPLMDDALFISELQSDALQGYTPVAETVKNRLKVDKNLIKANDINADEYLKQMLSTDGAGFEFGSSEYPSHVYAIMNHLSDLGEDSFLDNARKIMNSTVGLDTADDIATFLNMDVDDVYDFELEEIVSEINDSLRRASTKIQSGEKFSDALSSFILPDDAFVRASQKAQYPRLIQESARIAASKGKNKVLFPTGQTVSKIEKWDGLLDEKTRINMMRPYDKLDKDIKKTLGVAPRKVTIQGHEWWEVDLPDSYLKGEQEITAFGRGGKMRILKRKSL